MLTTPQLLEYSTRGSGFRGDWRRGEFTTGSDDIQLFPQTRRRGDTATRRKSEDNGNAALGSDRCVPASPCRRVASCAAALLVLLAAAAGAELIASDLRAFVAHRFG